MYQFILLIHVFAAVFIIALVLIQQGKGATVGAAFGSGASSTVFGSRGSGSFLFRITMSLGAIFFISSLSLNYLATRAYKQEKIITIPVNPMKQQKESSESAPATLPKSVTPNLPAEIPTR
jgi:preprotein translocase subunit SecG